MRDATPRFAAGWLAPSGPETHESAVSRHPWRRILRGELQRGRVRRRVEARDEATRSFMLVHYFPPVTFGLRPARLRRAMIGDLRRIHLAAAWGSLSWGQRAARVAAMPLWPLVALVSSLAWQVP